MELEIIIVNKIRLTQEDADHVLSVLCGIQASMGNVWEQGSLRHGNSELIMIKASYTQYGNVTEKQLLCGNTVLPKEKYERLTSTLKSPQRSYQQRNAN